LVPVDGRVSWVPPSASGLEPYNEYVVLADDRALLIDTGVALHAPSVLATLHDIVGSRRLTVYTTRIELDCIGNLARILDDFPDAQVATTVPIAPTGLIHVAASTPRPRPVKTLRMGEGLDEVGFARLRTISPLIQTLGTSWLWDGEAETLFTTDMFCGDMLSAPDDPVIRREMDAGVATADIREAVLSKFDWLAAADTGPLLARWDLLFGAMHPRVLAPIHGRVQLGRELVAQVIAQYRQAVFVPPAAPTRTAACAGRGDGQRATEHRS
jgi:flavorubredoxin